MSLLDDSRGRLRAGPRLLLFLLVFLASGLALALAIGLFLPDGGGAAGAWLSAPTLLLAALLASWALMERVEGVPVAALGLPVDRVAPREFGRGTLVGIALIGTAVLIPTALGAFRWRADPSGVALLPLLGSFFVLGLFLLLAALGEEVLVRGYPFQVLAERWGGAAAVAVTSVVFGLLHVVNPGLWPLTQITAGKAVSLLNITLAGVLLGVAYWRTYSLWYAGGIHFGWNWTMGFAADLPVSGIDPGQPAYGFFDTPGYEAVLTGEAGLWTGGGFGPEGGLAVTAVTCGAILWMLRTERLRRSLRILALGPLPDRDEASPTGGGPGSGSRREERAATEAG